MFLFLPQITDDHHFREARDLPMVRYEGSQHARDHAKGGGGETREGGTEEDWGEMGGTNNYCR